AGTPSRHYCSTSRKTARVCKRARIVEQLTRGRRSLALNAISAELVDRLWRQTDVAHHCDFFVDQTLYQLHAFMPAFEFHCLGAAFLYQPQRISHRVVSARMKRTVRHVGNEQRALHGASHRFQVDQDLVERYRNSVAVTQHHVSQTVADQDDVDT